MFGIPVSVPARGHTIFAGRSQASARSEHGCAFDHRAQGSGSKRQITGTLPEHRSLIMALAYRKLRPSTRTPLELVAPASAPALTPSPQLWLALMFPALLLEAPGVCVEERAAVAVLEGEDARARICAMTAGAV